MAWRSQSETNEGLIQQMQEYGIIKNETVANVLKQTDRKLYCRVAYPYVDRPHSIGFGATISAPHMHAFALENLTDFINPDSRILDVGAGSGFLTACFARLLNAKTIDNNGGESGSGFVVGIEHHPKLVEFAIGNINSDDPKMIEEGKVKIIQGDGRLGCDMYAQFDCIHVGAAAPQTPDALLKQLKPNGRMIIPVGPQGDTQQLEQYEKTISGEIVKKTLMSVVYVPLTDLNA